MTTVDEARVDFWARVEELDGEYVECPVCEHDERTYRWSMYETAAKCLGYYYKLGACTTPVASADVREAGHKGKGDETRLLNFGLIEKADIETDRKMFYMITPKGIHFLHGGPIEKYVWVFGKHRIVARSDEQATVFDVVKKKFDREAHLKNRW